MKNYISGRPKHKKNTGIPALRYPAFFLHRHVGAAHMLITYRYAYGNVR